MRTRSDLLNLNLSAHVVETVVELCRMAPLMVGTVVYSACYRRTVSSAWVGVERIRSLDNRRGTGTRRSTHHSHDRKSGLPAYNCRGPPALARSRSDFNLLATIIANR